jgi:hypothetical protein
MMLAVGSAVGALICLLLFMITVFEVVRQIRTAC